MADSIAITAAAFVNALGQGSLRAEPMVLRADPGSDVSPGLQRLHAGQSGLAATTELHDTDLHLPFATYVGIANGVNLALAAGPHASRVLALALSALEPIRSDVSRAIASYDPRRVGLFLGTSTGGLDRTEWAYAAHVQEGRLPATFSLPMQHDFHAVNSVVSERLGIAGPSQVVSTACSSSAKVFASAARMMRAGVIDAALVGGADALCRMTLQGFHGLGILSAERCRPFGRGRDGINIGEGAALIMLEKKAPRAIGYLRGVGESADAHNMSSPDPEGRGAALAMQRALAQAGLAPSDIDHVNAHGTATPQNDAAESLALHAVFGAVQPWVASTKGYVGHLLGAAGATEAIFALDAIQRGYVPASIGSTDADPACGIRLAMTPIVRPIRNVLSNSFAFGGSNCSLLLSSTSGEA